MQTLNLPAIALVLLMLCQSISAFSQTPDLTCGSDAAAIEQLMADPANAAKRAAVQAHRETIIASEADSEETYIIPVVWHILYNSPFENFTDAEIHNAMDILNDDFRRQNPDTANTRPMFKGIAADMNIEFVMAKFDPDGNPTTGITRKFTPIPSFNKVGDEIKFESTGGTAAWPTKDYLNIWVGDIEGTSGDLFGYAQFPWVNSEATDGAVIDYDVMPGGSTSYVNNGRVLTHEVGHWIGLLHNWSDTCGGPGDYVSDTPEQFGHAAFACFPSRFSCGSEDNIENYMDYNDNNCQNMFTEGQRTLGRAVFAPGGARESLLRSPGLYPCEQLVCEPSGTLGTGYISFVSLDSVGISSGLSTYTNHGPNNGFQVNHGGTYVFTAQHVPLFSPPVPMVLNVWIDFNGNEYFDDPGELVVTSPIFVGFSTTVSIPISASAGVRTMRVRVSDTGAEDVCDPAAGEVEDFCLEILQPCGPACLASGNTANGYINRVELPGEFDNTSGDNFGYSNFGTNFSAEMDQGTYFTLTGTPGFSGSASSQNWAVLIDYNRDGDFNDAGEVLATASGSSAVSMDCQIPYTAPANIPLVLRVVMAGGISPTGCDGTFDGEAEDYCITLREPECQAYCPYPGVPIADWIEEIRVGTLHNESGSNIGYEDFGFLPVEFTKGSSYTFELEPGNLGVAGFAEWGIWMDFNDDGDFIDAGEELFNTGALVSGSVTGTITIPVTALNGATRMRIMLTSNIAEPCVSSIIEFGEVEDYCVVVKDASDCDPSVAPTGLTSVVDGSNVTLSWNAVPGSLGCRIQGGPLGSFAGSIIRAGANQHTYSFPVPPGTYNWQVACACSVSPLIVTPASLPDTFSVTVARENLAAAFGEMGEIGISPNPTSGTLNIQYLSAQEGMLQLAVVDLLGRTVYTENIEAIVGNNWRTISLPELAPGKYLLTIVGSAEYAVGQFELVR